MLNTSSFGQACTQTKHGVLYGGEDCLFLNVFTHTNRNLIEIGDELLPVAFWIHGGTYISGDGSQYDAQELINFYNGSVIIVTINYRLNIFGFLGSNELRTLDAERGSTGTLGLQDQRLAMKWVQENIGKAI
jgi:para-nitrobenzyl esterase